MLLISPEDLKMKINEKGLQLLKLFEGRKLQAYQDQGGKWTIGYGHTGPEVIKGLVWSPEEAEQALENDLRKRVYPLWDFVIEQINDNQWSALCSLCFNVGLTAVKNSNTLRLINEGRDPSIEWLGFSHINGVSNAGLLRRRKAELALYHELS